MAAALFPRMMPAALNPPSTQADARYLHVGPDYRALCDRPPPYRLAESAAGNSHRDRYNGPNYGADLVRLDDAMNALARIDARKAQVVEMRFFRELSGGEHGPGAMEANR